MKRIPVEGLMLCACFVSVTWGQQPTCPAYTPWAQFLRHNMGRWSPCEKVLSVQNVGKLSFKWSYATAAGSSVESSPTVADEMVYVGTYSDGGYGQGILYALNARTGALLWSYDMGSIFSSPAVVNGVAYIGSDDGNMYALNAKTGDLLWSYGTGDLVESPPTVEYGVVYFGSVNGSLYALNASTGALLWSYAANEIYSPAVAKGVVYLTTFNGKAYALKASTGVLLWSYVSPNDTQGTSAPAVADGLVYVVTNLDQIYALNARTGAVVWSSNVAFFAVSSPAVANGGGLFWLGRLQRVRAECPHGRQAVELHHRQ
jgi:outer membrane protein assembly factor BamB